MLDHLLHRQTQRPIAGWRLRASLVSIAVFVFVGKVGELWGLTIGKST